MALPENDQRDAGQLSWGEKFRIVCATRRNGSRPALDGWRNLSSGERTSFMTLFVRMCCHGKIFNEEQFHHQVGEIYAFKRSGSFKLRIYCFFGPNRTVYLTHVVQKKEDEASQSDLNLAEAVRQEQVAALSVSAPRKSQPGQRNQRTSGGKRRKG